MCGVIYAQSFNGTPVNETVFNQYVDQRSRGFQGFGVFNGKHLFHAAMEERIVNWLVKPKNDSELLMFHHRYPTSTINVKKAAHPFTSKDRYGDTQYVLIHNGTVSNAKELREKHEKMGIKYHSVLEDNTFNDSEALMWDVAETLEGKQEKLTAYGNIAFICMKMVKGQKSKLYFARNTRPMNMLRTKDQLVLSSEGEGKSIDSDKLYTFNYDLKRLTTKFFKIHAFKPYEGGYWDSKGYHSYQYQNNTYGTPNRSRKWEDSWENYDVNGHRYDDLDYVFDDEDMRDFPTIPAPVKRGDVKQGTHIGQYLRQRYQRLLASGGEEDDDEYNELNNISDYEWEYDPKTQTYLPLDAESAAEQRFDRMWNLVDDPDQKVVENLALTYLALNNGSFAQALWQVSEEFEELNFEPLTEERVTKQKVLERVEAFIEDDSEYLTEDSVSSLYESGLIYA